MINRFCLLVLIGCCTLLTGTPVAQDSADPLAQLTKSFPKTIEIKNISNAKRVLEFCPDNTCDGFVASQEVSVATLKEFVYLFEYFFSGFIYLEDWRRLDEAKNTAGLVLGNPAYRNCANDDRRAAARCVLLKLSKNGKIKLIFISYDEGQRNVVPENIAEQLSK